MYGLKQLLVLALAGPGLACQCTAYGSPDGEIDTEATKRACVPAGGRLTPGGQ
ncbi:hypothetical protein EG328_007856 [Venturia inaequalis]|uniref:Uncharacterized protein n=1 Tax=Venturia inaequalis TaxID=5025 RepID=A0A8H3VAG5_VENIN|nr:hypothetical protein EG328_007856 [Venturia inaequalis]KAE9990600.1 hypothetical protein EG327_001151 [Venturia inaequalis]